VQLQPGAVVRIQTPGGGGYGPPSEREGARVIDELDAGLVSPKAAREVHGASVDDGGR